MRNLKTQVIVPKEIQDEIDTFGALDLPLIKPVRRLKLKS